MKRFVGDWWLPEEPDETCRGELEVEPYEDATLTLRGSLPGLDFSSSGEVIGLLLGRTGSDDLLTVCKCAVGQVFSTGSGFEVKATIYPHYVLVGAHFSRPDDIRFSSVTVEFEHLPEWAAQRVIEREVETDADDRVTAITSTYRRPGPIQVDLRGLQLRLESRWSGRFGSGPKLRLDHIPYIRLRPNQPRSLTSFLNSALVPFELFLTMGVGQGVGVLRATGLLPSDADVPTDGDTSRVRIYYLDRRPLSDEDVSPEPMFFRMRDLGDRSDIVRCLRLWYEKADWLVSVASLYVAALYRPTYGDNEFLNLTQALESFHRNSPEYDGLYLPPERYQDLVFDPLMEALPAEVPSDLQASLREGTLKYGKEYSLRKRLTELVGSVVDVAGPVLQPNPEVFIGRVIDTRNFLVHKDESLRNDAAVGQELAYMTKRLRVVLEALFFHEIDLPEDSQRDIFRRSLWFEELSHS